MLKKSKGKGLVFGVEMDNPTKCPNCGKTKKPWFKLCYECSQKEKQKPTCEICGIEVPEGHYLCKEHWIERKEQQKDLKKISYVKNWKEKEFKEKFEGKYYLNSQRVKSKSELLICYFLEANGVQFQYEPLMDIDGEIRPDFVINNKQGKFVILQHFGLDDKEYTNKKEMKIKKYNELCKKEKEFSFIQTDEDDIYNLKDRLGQKLNTTPLRKAFWK
jgi:hypothetical protein